MRWRKDSNLLLAAHSITEGDLANEDVAFCWVQLLDNLTFCDARNEPNWVSGLYLEHFIQLLLADV